MDFKCVLHTSSANIYNNISALHYSTRLQISPHVKHIQSWRDIIQLHPHIGHLNPTVRHISLRVDVSFPPLNQSPYGH